MVSIPLLLLTAGMVMLAGMWFTNNYPSSIGRITTSGAVSKFTGNGIGNPTGITAGQDGALQVWVVKPPNILVERR